MAARGLKDPASQLRFATRRAKSDVANKLVSTFLHELSRRISESWPTKVDSKGYEDLVRGVFNNQCPYCSCDLALVDCIIEHLDGMNRYRAGLHVPGNVLVACKQCNSEKRRDDSLKTLSLAGSGWESFLSHNGTSCAVSCITCQYWRNTWEDETERRLRLNENLQRVRRFRDSFPEFGQVLPSLKEVLPPLLTKLYCDFQSFAETEIKFLLERFEHTSEIPI
jgi:hypothetical protein